MLKYYYKNLSVGILLISLTGCYAVSSQTAISEKKPPQSEVIIDNGQNPVISLKQNSKYKLSVTFYEKKNEPPFYSYYSKLRNDKTGKEIFLAEYGATTESLSEGIQQVWSPDEEHLMVANGINGGYLIYRTSDILKNLNKTGKIKLGKAIDDVISVVSSKGNPEYEHQFIRWESDNSFIFQAAHFKYKGNKREKSEPDTYKYDIAKRKLYRVGDNSGWFLKKGQSPKKIGKENDRLN